MKPISKTTTTTTTTVTGTTTTTTSFSLEGPNVTYVTRDPVPSTLDWFADILAEQPRIVEKHTEVFNVQCQTPYNLVVSILKCYEHHY